MTEIKLYFPVEIKTYENDSTYPIVIDGVPYKDKIIDTVKLIDVSAGERGLMAFFNKQKYPRINDKVQSILLTIKEINNALYCETTICTKDNSNLTENEISRIKDYITGQYSDGIGEVLEQTTIFADDNEIYASLWQDSDWKLCTIDELNQTISSNHMIPDAPMIGADGNVFHQLSIAKKALIENGQDYAANEMISRVMNSNSYDKALRIICEYVNPVDKNKHIKPRKRGNSGKER